MRKASAVIFLAAAFAMNTHQLCRVLCAAQLDGAHSHGTAGGGLPAVAGCHMDEGVRPAAASGGPESRTSIKCHCPDDHAPLAGYATVTALDLTPELKVISKIQPRETLLQSHEPASVERPPELPA